MRFLGFLARIKYFVGVVDWRLISDPVEYNWPGAWIGYREPVCQHILNFLRVSKGICREGSQPVASAFAVFYFPSLLSSDELELPDMRITDRLMIAEAIENIESGGNIEGNR